MYSAMIEFPNSVIAMSIDNIDDEEGFILAISTSIDSQDELSNYLKTLPDDIIVYKGGLYSEGDNIFVQHITLGD